MALTTIQKKSLIMIDFPSSIPSIAAVVNTQGLTHNWRWGTCPIRCILLQNYDDLLAFTAMIESIDLYGHAGKQSQHHCWCFMYNRRAGVLKALH